MSVESPRRTSGAETRERILFVAANLFAQLGYHGTSTRQIADAVGIRQPSLFHHFASKSAIAEALLDWDLGRALPRVRAIAARDEPAAVRLYRYLRFDLDHLATSPYNLSAIYNEEVIGTPEFADWAAKRDQLHLMVQSIVSDGIAAGEFIQIDPPIVRQAIAGILVRTLTLHSGGRGEGGALAHQVARLIVRGLLLDPSQIDEVRRTVDETRD